MRLLFGLILALGIPAAVAQEPYIVRGDVEGCVNVRESHSTGSESVACLGAGSPISVIGSEPYWREIDFAGPSPGWIAKKFIVPAPGTAPVPPPTDTSDMWLTVHFVDVGQGDAIWINTPDDGIDNNGRFEGRNIVIDGGPYSSDENNALLPYLESQGHHGAVVDALIVSHPHSDHFYGAETLVRHFEIDHYYDPGYPSTLSSYAAFINSFDDPGRTVNNTHIGHANFGTFGWGDELGVEVLYSWNDDPGLGSGNTRVNNSSMVMKVTYGAHSFLLMGDAEGKDRNDLPAPPRYVEQILLANPALLPSTVLKVGHHGSETSSTTDFIEAVNPDYLVVQSGRKCFNHRQIPDMTTLQRYCSHNGDIEIYRTDHDDAGATPLDAVDGDNIVIRTNGAAIEVVEGAQTACGSLPAPARMPQC